MLAMAKAGSAGVPACTVPKARITLGITLPRHTPSRLFPPPLDYNIARSKQSLHRRHTMEDAAPQSARHPQRTLPTRLLVVLLVVVIFGA